MEETAAPPATVDALDQTVEPRNVRVILNEQDANEQSLHNDLAESVGGDMDNSAASVDGEQREYPVVTGDREDGQRTKGDVAQAHPRQPYQDSRRSPSTGSQPCSAHHADQRLGSPVRIRRFR